MVGHITTSVAPKKCHPLHSLRAMADYHEVTHFAVSDTQSVLPWVTIVTEGERRTFLYRPLTPQDIVNDENVQNAVPYIGTVRLQMVGDHATGRKLTFTFPKVRLHLMRRRLLRNRQQVSLHRPHLLLRLHQSPREARLYLH
jgi:hypothetical protein